MSFADDGIWFWDHTQPKPRREERKPDIDVARTLACEGGFPMEVSEYIEDRMRASAERYGERLTTFNGRNTLLDALEEACDLLVYLRQTRLQEHWRDYHEYDPQKQNPSWIRKSVLGQMESSAKELFSALYYFVKHDLTGMEDVSVLEEYIDDPDYVKREVKLRRFYKEHFPGVFDRVEDGMPWNVEAPPVDEIERWETERTSEEE